MSVPDHIEGDEPFVDVVNHTEEPDAEKPSAADVKPPKKSISASARLCFGITAAFLTFAFAYATGLTTTPQLQLYRWATEAPFGTFSGSMVICFLLCGYLVFLLPKNWNGLAATPFVVNIAGWISFGWYNMVVDGMFDDYSTPITCTGAVLVVLASCLFSACVGFHSEVRLIDKLQASLFLSLFVNATTFFLAFGVCAMVYGESENSPRNLMRRYEACRMEHYWPLSSDVCDQYLPPPDQKTQ